MTFFKQLFYRLDVAKEVSSQGEDHHPDHAANDIVRDKLRIVHASHAGYKRRKGAHDGDKTRQDDGFATMLFVESLGFVPQAGDEVRPIGFSSDNGLPYNYI